MIKSIEIKNYRGFKYHRINFKDISLLVGKNNAGKSTIIEILRLCSLIIKRSRNLQYKEIPNWVEYTESTTSRLRVKGVSPDIKGLIRQYPTVFHKYEDNQPYAKITFESNAYVEIFYNKEEQIYAILTDKEGKIISNKSSKSLDDFIDIAVLPQIGPLNLQEKILQDDYIRKFELHPVTSLHFRNKLYRNQELISEFNSIIQETWQGVQIYSIDMGQENLSLMMRESDFVAEVGAMGHGIQMWLQIIWFIMTSKNSNTLIVDEPDVYLHPDLQKKLYNLLIATGKQVILSSHSIAIASEALPSSILVIEKSNMQSKYVKPEDYTELTNIYANCNSSDLSFSQQVATIENAFDVLISNQELINISDNSEILRIPVLKKIIDKKVKNRIIIPFAEGKYISLNKLSLCGVTIDDINDYTRAIYNFVGDNYFTLFSLEKMGFKHKIDSLGFQNYFYESLLMSSSNVKYRIIQTQKIYKFSDNDFLIEDFIASLNIPSNGIDIYDLMQMVKNNYNIIININNLVSKLLNSNKLYYNATIKKLYNSYDDYFNSI